MISGSSKWYAVIHPMNLYGHWTVNRVIPFFRWLGRKLHSRRVYWLGFQVEWIPGILEGLDKMKWYGGYNEATHIENLGKIMMDKVDELAKSK